MKKMTAAVVLFLLLSACGDFPSVWGLAEKDSQNFITEKCQRSYYNASGVKTYVCGEHEWTEYDLNWKFYNQRMERMRQSS